MKQALEDLYHELLRLKANGTQSLYVDPQSIEALITARSRHNEQPPKEQIQAHHRADIKTSKTKLPQTNESPSELSQAELPRIQLPEGTHSEQLLWLEKSTASTLRLNDLNQFHLELEAIKPIYWFVVIKLHLIAKKVSKVRCYQRFFKLWNLRMHPYTQLTLLSLPLTNIQ